MNTEGSGTCLTSRRFAKNLGAFCPTYFTGGVTIYGACHDGFFLPAAVFSHSSDDNPTWLNVDIRFVIATIMFFGVGITSGIRFGHEVFDPIARPSLLWEIMWELLFLAMVLTMLNAMLKH